MPMSTRPKNADQHPGHILLADMRKRRTKTEMEADKVKKKVDTEITEAALNKLYQFIAEEEDHLAEEEINAHGKKISPPVCIRPRPLVRRNAFIIHESSSEHTIGASTEQRKYAGVSYVGLRLTEI